MKPNFNLNFHNYFIFSMKKLSFLFILETYTVFMKISNFTRVKSSHHLRIIVVTMNNFISTF